MNPISYIESRKYKNNKSWYNIKKIFAYCIPNFFFRSRLQSKLQLIDKYDRAEILERVNYYNKLSAAYSCGANIGYYKELKEDTAAVCREGFIKIKNFTLAKKYTPFTHYMDTYKYVRYFDGNLFMSFFFGDVTQIPVVPQIVKSRPIVADNANSIVLNLNKLRHFIFVDDNIEFKDKKDRLIGRGAIFQPHRIRFYEKYFGNPMCDLGHVGGDNGHPDWKKDKLPISRHLIYKYILCLEGNDVASNLKWVMSSNSIAVMPRPKYETWFMEGKLIPNFHYIEIKEDYSDLEEKLMYYNEHTDEALEIIENAHAYIRQFMDSDKEDLIALMVLQKYFDYQRD